MSARGPVLTITTLLVLVLFTAGLAGQSEAARKATRARRQAHHPLKTEGRADELNALTRRVSKTLPFSPVIPIAEKNYVDEHIFGKILQDRVPHASLCSDVEFLRRVSLDLTGRLPEPEKIREFVNDPDPQKREKLVDAIMRTDVRGAIGPKFRTPFLDRWAYFFSDLFRVNIFMGGRGKNLFYDHIYNFLLVNQPYDQFARDLLTARTRSSDNSAEANLLVRFYVDEPDQITVNHEDYYDELAIHTTRMFLGINLECISCHDGASHLDKINLWLSGRERAELWRQAAFFGKVRLYRPYGDLIDEFVLSDEGKGYDLSSRSVLRPPRYPIDVTPAFILTHL